MKRRVFIQMLPMLYSSLALAQPPNPLGSSSIPTTDNSKKYLDLQEHASRRSDGSWSLWVRAVLKGSDFRSAIPLTLLIATDPTFSQIVFQQKITATPERSFIATNQYTSPYPTALLYYKYVVENAAMLALSGKSVSISSETKTLSPWPS